MSKEPPWTIHPSLTADRLSKIAQLIKQVRHDAVLQHEPSKGDNPWSLGCRAYARICHAIAEKVKEGTWNWLSIVEDKGLRFVFAIGGVPFRFYKGDPDERNPRTLRLRYPEIRAQQLALEFYSRLQLEMVFRLAVEIDDLGEVESVTVVQLDEDGEPHNPWPIPLDDNVAVAPIRPPREAVELPHPLQFPGRDARKLREDEGDGS